MTRQQKQTDTVSNSVRATNSVSLRIHTLGTFRVEWVDPQTGQVQPLPPERLQKRGAAPALGLLQALLSRPNRFATRDWLLEQFWPDSSARSASDRLDDVASALRGLLRPEGCQDKTLHFVYGADGRGNGYRLEGYPSLWCDADALAWHVEQAARMQRYGDDPLPFWQRAYDLASCGVYLAEEIYSDWPKARRAEASGHLRQAVHALARLYLERSGKAGEEEALLVLRTYWLDHPTDEDALRQLMELLGKRERFQEALAYYERLHTLLEEDGQEPTTQTKDVAAYMRTKQVQRPPRHKLIEMPATLSTEEKHAYLPAFQESPPEQRNTMNRQEFLYGSARMVGATLLMPSHDMPDSEILERFFYAIAKPSSLDQTTLDYLHRRTANYYRDRHDANVASSDVLSYALDHFQKVTALLEAPLLPKMRTHLCSLAGEVAQLVGELHFEIGSYTKAREFHKAAILSAREAHNQTLEAIAWGWMSFAWTYNQKTQEALPCVQEARRLAAHSANSTVRAWLAAIEAEIWANLGDLHACRTALDEADCIDEQEASKEESYWIHFDRSLLAGYRGICFLRLYRPELDQRTSLLGEAQRALTEALVRLDPTLMRRRPTYLLDLADTYLQEREIGQACEYALQSLEMAARIKSRMISERLIALRRELEPWKHTQEVQILDEHIAPLLRAGQH